MSRRTTLVRSAALAAVYFATGRIGLLLPIVQDNVTLLWAPSGIALASVLLFGPRLWPGIFLGAFLVNLSTAAPAGVALATATGNTLEALAGLWLLREVAGFQTSLERVRDVLALTVLAAGGAPIVGATFGATSLFLGGVLPADQVAAVWTYWWLGDAMGILLVAPVLLTWASTRPRRDGSPPRVLEALALPVLLALASLLSLGTWIDESVTNPPLSFTVFPFLVWAALRFGQRGAVSINLLAVSIAIWATLRGFAPFARGTLEERLVYLHTYMTVAAVTSMLLAAILAERFRAEEALRESEERLRLALDAGRCGVWDWDLQKDRITWSDLIYEFHGLAPGTFGGRVEDFAVLVHPEDRERVSEAIRRSVETGQDYQAEMRVVQPNGAVRWISTNGRVYRDESGRPVRMLGATLDVTERRQAEEELRQAMAAAEEANEAKDRFLATLSHELRTPLTPVLAIVSRLEEDERARGFKDDLVRIRRNVELEARLIDDLLDLTRVARGKLELHPEIADARKMVEHTLQICCEEATASGRLRVVTDFQAGDHRIWGDPSRVTQILWNLLNNAIKFTPAGGTITIRSWREEGPTLVLEVGDTGIGIEPERLPQIFGAFEQAHARSRRIGGLGLGLAISHTIAEMHGGSLTARSEGPGRGATFSLRLPVGALPVLDAPEPRAESQRPEALAARSLTILLVEDHADTAEAMADLLGLLGHQVITAGSVAAGLAAAERAWTNGGLDLVVSDLGLPDGSGVDLMRELSGRYGVPGIALSGYGMEEDIRQSLEAGFSRHLTKPVNPQSLKAALQEVAGNKRAHPGR
ncbi:MAG TPA: MASE1 domain-containing protein [Thermoanaerobaculia bacterium]|nr:MASE1 domain-containing protein [Thermoanaerobaculia bacterium]